MPSSSIPARGPAGAAVTGYRLAWTHRRRLLPAVAAVLAPALLAQLALSLSLGRDHLLVADGGLTVHGAGAALSWAGLGLSVVSWLLAVGAGTSTVAGALRGTPVRPLAAIVAASRQFPLLALGLCAAVGATVLAVWVVSGVGGYPGLALILAILAAGALVAARALLGVVSSWLGGTGRPAGAFVLGGIVVPLLLACLNQAVRPSLPWPLLAEVIDALLLAGVVAAQAGVLAHLGSPAPADAGVAAQLHSPAADAGAPAQLQSVAPAAEVGGPVRPEPAAPAAGPARWAWLAVAALLIPALLTTGVAVTNPVGATSLRSYDDALTDAVAVAWPPGQHPVIVSTVGVRFCDTDLCDRYVAHTGGPAVMEGWGTAGIGPDGSVVRAALTGGQDSGGPFIHYARCTRQGCRGGWTPVRASAREPFGWPELAVTSAPDGAIWFALAMPSPEDQPGEPTYRISLIRCADPECGKPQRHELGTTPRTPSDGYAEGRRARLSVAADGRPTAGFWIGSSLLLVTCEPVTCARPRRSEAEAGPADALWDVPARQDQPVVSFQPGRLKIGDQWVPLESEPVKPGSGAVAVSGSRVYATAAAATGRPSGFWVSVGTPTTYRQQILWICERASCRRHPLDVRPDTGGRELLAVGPDGRVLLVRPDRLTLVTPR